MHPSTRPRNIASTAEPGQTRPPFGPSRPRPPCFWCDTTEHSECQELKEAICRGEDKFDDTGRIVNCSTGMAVPLMTGRGGMKVLFAAPALPPKTIAVSTSAISLNQPTASLGATTTVHLVTINPDGTEYHEIIDAEVNEKRRRNDIGKGTKLPEANPHSMDSELPHRQPNTQASNRYPALPALNNSNRLPMFQCVMCNLDNRSTGLALNYVSLLRLNKLVRRS
jgi:hypothetical protein